MGENAEESKSERLLRFFKEKATAFKKRIGIVDQKARISFELSEFMQESKSALQELPPNYKKLFEHRPASGSFFLNREEELKKLHKAFTNWTKNRFVACALVGEKGSGITSMLNAFLDAIPPTDTIQAQLHEKIYTEASYFAFFNTLLGTKDLKSNKEIIDHLNASQSATIVILENLHHMFLKKVGGFESMKLLFELISYTTKKILWIGVFTPETWSYLDKTLSLGNYFTNEITMQPLEKEVIKEIFFLRNEYENLAIKFVAQEDTLQSKVFKKLDDDNEKQLFLEEKFFKTLHKLSNGNISLAQLYWVRSIKKSKEKTLFLTEIDDLDASFLKNLSAEDLFALQVLIVHDGLTLHDFTAVTHESEEECRKVLMPMLEKGLLIQPHEKYNINPAIYKELHDFLSSKNFIH